jgi:hypothetical protein
MIGEPRVGWVLRYSYLWAADHEAGVEEGSKDRPCAVIASIKSQDGNLFVRALPITRTPPQDPKTAVENPPSQRLALDLVESGRGSSARRATASPGPALMCGRFRCECRLPCVTDRFRLVCSIMCLVRCLNWHVPTAIATSPAAIEIWRRPFGWDGGCTRVRRRRVVQISCPPASLALGWRDPRRGVPSALCGRG